ncbi:hypothetical protein DOY81_012546, partial [Sarcophaga bullata]
FSLIIVSILVTMICRNLAGPVEVEKTSDDLKTSETYGYGYYEPNLYTAPLVSHTVPLATTSVVAAPLATAPLATAPAISSASAGYARSGYGYGSGYKYGSGYGYGNRWGYGGNAGLNEFIFRRSSCLCCMGEYTYQQ